MLYVYGVSGRQVLAQEAAAAMAAARPVPRMRPVDPVAQGAGARPLHQEDEHAPGSRGHNAASRSALAAYGGGGGSHHHRVQLVGEVMARGVATVEADSALVAAWAAMARSDGARQVPVVDAQGVLVGLLLRDDLLGPAWLDWLPSAPDDAQGTSPGPDAAVRRAAIACAQAWSTMLARPVSAWMRSPVPGLTERTELRDAAAALLDCGLPALPVVDEQDHVAGLLTRDDLVRVVGAEPALELWG